jgi:hypothetical protein
VDIIEDKSNNNELIKRVKDNSDCVESDTLNEENNDSCK